MKSPLTNNQNILAEELLIAETQVRRESYEAVLKIKRWKFIMNIPGIGKRIRLEAEESIRRTFLTYVPGTDVLIEEGYFFRPSDN